MGSSWPWVGGRSTSCPLDVGLGQDGSETDDVKTVETMLDGCVSTGEGIETDDEDEVGDGDTEVDDRREEDDDDDDNEKAVEAIWEASVVGG